MLARANQEFVEQSSQRPRTPSPNEKAIDTRSPNDQPAIPPSNPKEPDEIYRGDPRPTPSVQIAIQVLTSEVVTGVSA